MNKRRRLTYSNASLVVRALLALMACTTVVRLLPFACLRLLWGYVTRLDRERSRMPAARVLRAMSLVEPWVLFTNCLGVALAACYMLRRYGYAADLRIGVSKEDVRALDAHAWVELDGRVFVGGSRSPLRYRNLKSPMENVVRAMGREA